MDAAQVKALLDGHLDNCRVEVQGEGSNYDILVIGAAFEGLRPVRRQQLVYGALNEAIGNGSIHAVNIRTFTEQEWQAQG